MPKDKYSLCKGNTAYSGRVCFCFYYILFFSLREEILAAYGPGFARQLSRQTATREAAGQSLSPRSRLPYKIGSTHTSPELRHLQTEMTRVREAAQREKSSGRLGSSAVWSQTESQKRSSSAARRRLLRQQREAAIRREEEKEFLSLLSLQKCNEEL